MVKVCDALMGSGKSQSAITYMNEHQDKKFVYITPYLDEADRIRDGCPGLEFVKPSDKIPQFGFSKLEHTRCLLKDGENISTTHSAFRSYTPDMIEAISSNHYTLIVDEAVDVFQEAKYSDGDIQLLLDGGYVRCEDDVFIYTGREYTGERLGDLFEMLRCNNLMRVEKSAHGSQYYFWSIPRDILCAFDDVFVLTYLFDSSEFKYFFDLYGISYQNIGIQRDGGGYRFADKPLYVPEYINDLQNKIHIFDNPKLNDVGKNRYALSSNWLKNHDAERNALKNNLYNYLHNYQRGRCEEIMWSTYKGNVNSLKGRGYAKQNVTFNMKATNEYRERTILAYLVNIFASPHKIRFFANHGIQYDEDGFALSTMIQWIWRSAIRDGKAVNLYIPSRRMRELLTNWIKEVKES